MNRSTLSLFPAALFVVVMISCSDDSTTVVNTPPDTTPPTVTSASPVDAFHIEVLFNENVQRETAERRDNYVILEVVAPLLSGGPMASPGDTLHVGSASLSTDQRTVTISTLGPMAAVNYDMSVTNVTDVSGNKITSPVVGSFVGVTTPDVTPPVITSRSPAPGATGVGVGQPVLFQFSEPADYSSVVNGASWAVTGGGSPVSYHVESEGGTSYGLILDSPLATGTQYTVTLTGVTDFFANTMPPASWSFTTTFTTDTTPPTVVSTSPANGATNVSVNTNLSLTLSEAVNQATFQPVLSPDVGNGTAVWSNGGKTVTFDPDLPLATNQAYTITFLPGTFEDLAGNKNVQILNVVFSTGSTLPAGSFAGTITGHPGTAAADPTGAIVAAANAFIFDNDDINILGSDVVAGNNTYDIRRLPDGVYYPIAVMNTNGDNELDPSSGDAVGLYGVDFLLGDMSPDSLTISGGNRLTGINFPLIDMSAIAGRVSYSGSYAGGFYALNIGVFETVGFDPTNPPDYGTSGSWPNNPEFRFNGLDDGLADGTYYVGAYIDVNSNDQYDPNTDPAGLYGGSTPTAVTIQNGSDAVGLNIVVADPLTPTGPAAGVTWPAPARRAPWLQKLSEAVRRR